MRYELWHIHSASLMDDFKDEADALAVARAYLAPDKDGVSVDVTLLVYDDDGQAASVHGDELAAMVFGSAPDQMRQPA